MGGPVLVQFLPALSSLLCVFPFPTDSKLLVPALTKRPDCPDRRHWGWPVAPACARPEWDRSERWVAPVSAPGITVTTTCLRP